MENEKEQYAGPDGLDKALAAAEEGPGGIRLAISVPNGDLIAVQAGKTKSIRRVSRTSGQAGSIVGTGEWITDEEAIAQFAKMSWRPA